MTRATVYDQSHYQAYSQGAATRLTRVCSVNPALSVDFQLGPACTDGSTVWLPPINGNVYGREFDAMCGTTYHELAHVIFKSNGIIKAKFPRFFSDPLLRDAMNIVIDVVDETHLSALDKAGTATKLFWAGRVVWAEEAVEAVRNGEWEKKPLHWRIGCIAMMFAHGYVRGNSSAGYLKTIRMLHNRTFGMDGKPAYHAVSDIVKILRKIRTTRRVKNTGRSSARWNAIADAADKVAAILKPFWTPPPVQPTACVSVCSGSGSGNDGQAMPGEASANEQGNAAQAGDGSASGVGADVQIVACKGLSGGTPSSASPELGGDGAGGGAGNLQANAGQGKHWLWDEHTFRTTSGPIGELVSQMIETLNAERDTGAYMNGRRVAHAHRVHTDFRMYGQHGLDVGEQISAALLVDLSGSMQDGWLRRLLPAAEALAQSLEQHGDVLRIQFASDYSIVQHLGADAARGGTSTVPPITHAREWLKNRAGRKWLVMFTDGVPNQEIEQMSLLRKMRDIDRINLMAVCIGGCSKKVARTWPSCTPVVTADNGAQIIAAAHRVGAMITA